MDCYCINNCSAKSGESLSCTLFPSALGTYPDPAIIKIENHDEILEFTTNIEIHILDVTTPVGACGGGMKLGAYETYGDSSSTDIVLRTSYN